VVLESEPWAEGAVYSDAGCTVLNCPRRRSYAPLRITPVGLCNASPFLESSPSLTHLIGPEVPPGTGSR
jgi:hypothetical protein